MSRVATVALGTCCQLCRGEGGWVAWEQVVMLEGQEETSTTMGTIGQKGWATVTAHKEAARGSWSRAVLGRGKHQPSQKEAKLWGS